ncbi:MAG TPA: hypothetical protein VFB59_05945 [Candidatus Saccharimonadales bacterium]|nr:hypothetical protein [Candidatus Saccharimonadales bacterium]
MKHISGINISSFTEPIREALKGYQWDSGGKVGFDLDRAAKLELTP